jgi:alginate O-acetyltransferase complex protein AlgI
LVFSSLTFLFGFLPALLVIYFAIPARKRNMRNNVLLLFSLFFYAYGGLRLLPMILISIVMNYGFGLLVSEGFSKRVQTVSAVCAAVGNLGLLVWFKYAGFLSQNLNAMGLSIPVVNVILPIGISFYTFHGLSYVFDIYHKNVEPERNILRVALYLVLFPQLVAGPIIRYNTVADKLVDRTETLNDFSEGAVRFVFGLAKKILIANPMGQVADAAFGVSTNNLSAGLAWLGVLAYTLQIYFDFSGYSDMAIGLGRMFGFHFLENFNYPYIARSITDFWRRWHISLSSWFRDYLYIPLGGNRVSLAKQIRNLLIVWSLTGLWHGAAWNYLLWGFYYAVLLIGERYLWGKLLQQAPRAVSHIYALCFIMIGWLIFRSSGLEQSISFLKAMVGAGAAGGWNDQATYYLLEYRWELLIAVIASLPLKNAVQKAMEKRKEQLWANGLCIFAPPVLSLGLGFLSVMRLVSNGFNPFIYFQF